MWRKENRRTRRKAIGARTTENQQKNSTHIWRQVEDQDPGQIDGKRALSSPRYPCSSLNITLNHIHFVSYESFLFFYSIGRFSQANCTFFYKENMWIFVGFLDGMLFLLLSWKELLDAIPYTTGPKLKFFFPFSGHKTGSKDPRT